MLDLFGLLVSFAVIVLLVRKNVNFGIAMLVGSLTIGIIAFTPTSLLSTAWMVISDKTTINLAAVILCISILAHLMKRSGQIDRMTSGLRGLAKDTRAVLSGFPAIFGLLPVPGGALLSAPMVEEESEKLEVDPKDRTFLNFWFRHIWFYIFPLFPGLIFASELSGISIYRLALVQVPMFLAALGVGLFALRRISSHDEAPRPRDGGLAKMIKGASPIIIALVLSMLLGLPIFLALIVAIITSFLIAGPKLKDPLNVFKEGLSLDLLIAVIGIMLFKGLVEGSGAMVTLKRLIVLHNIPLILVATTLPFLIGLVTGSDIGAVGLSFPIVLPLFSEITLPLVSFLYISAFLGYLVSPLHLCIILTCDFFSVNLWDVYPPLIAGAGVVFLTAVLTLGLLLGI
ncbi:hypothetical protein AKJ45_01170 [candidate division MSBL1 archaeon SCGC-AAA261F19]|uniref:DUF401 family protein n=2 Tax=candidate division MSBL1 TaxID=215777 RepID=A0A133VAV8_9EURY|nr:hypothetical protein AKJ43_00155 [candidate division MSBL1 archaeon SCGC-AAA261D19]KXB03598.1 hypothetical protein AKJ45_01170 [candidate division MSBL1 archaeon SCGC-AAA261F19]